MVFIQHQNRRPILWLRFGILLFFVFLFFIFGGKSLVIKGTIYLQNTLSFSKDISTPEQTAMLKAKIADLEKERDNLNILIGNTYNKNIVPANVSLGGGYLFSDSIIVDRGANSGVAIDDYVTTIDGMFVGKVISVGANWSSIVPFTRLGQKTVIRGGQNKEIVFEVSGIGGGETSADLPGSLDIKIGDIFWSGEYPDFIIGIVNGIDSSQAKQIQTVYFGPPVALKFLTFVNIHKKNI